VKTTHPPPTRETDPELWAKAEELKLQRGCLCDGPDNFHRTEWWPCACLSDAAKELGYGEG
jgi:hypothetical protein